MTLQQFKEGKSAMNVQELYKNAENYVINELQKLDYPCEHPFNGYPRTPESMALRLIVFIKALTNKDELVVSFLKKCKSLENGVFSYIKYNQNVSEIIWLYYMYSGLIKTNSQDSLMDIYGEDFSIYDNDKKFEYSLLISIDDVKYIITSEVKAITCDPFFKEVGLKAIDGQRLIKPLFPALKDSDVLKSDPNAIVLKSSTYYYQTGQNIKKIINKCRGNKLIDNPIFNIGVLFVNFSTSFEEFYSYLFHKTYGIYNKLLESNVDAIVLISLDAHNDFDFENLYSSGYVQTVLVKPTPQNRAICERLKIDNYIALGKSIDKNVYEAAQEEFGKYKILCREGFLNIIPYDSTEEQISEYLYYLKSDKTRY